MTTVAGPTKGPRRGGSGSGKALLLTVLGELVLPSGGRVWTATVVRGLAALGIEERNARQAIARLADDGLVRSERVGRRARWELTGRGRELLTTGTERIYRFAAGADDWDGRWSIVLCSVPEEQRAKRHQLRTRLGFAGYGFLAAGVAASPHADREPAARAVLADLDLTAGAIVLRAEAGGAIEDADIIRRAWDLATLGDDYRSFIAAIEDRRPASAEGAFVALVELVHAWRRFPFVDPEVPSRLLPAAWPGHRAKRLFDECHARWSPDARRWYAELEDGAVS